MASRLVRHYFLTIVLLQYFLNLMLLVRMWCGCEVKFLICSERNAFAIARCCDSDDIDSLCYALAFLCAMWFGCAVGCDKCMDSAV